jgi:hypothetical protein
VEHRHAQRGVEAHFEPFKNGTYTPNVMRKVFDPEALHRSS